MLAIIIFLAVCAALWFFAHRAQDEALALGDSSLCWTASCRDAVIAQNADASTRKLKRAAY
jgi:uncharacterized membrane protein (GlpM family)